jgi:hypothetical protein
MSSDRQRDNTRHNVRRSWVRCGNAALDHDNHGPRGRSCDTAMPPWSMTAWERWSMGPMLHDADAAMDQRSRTPWPHSSLMISQTVPFCAEIPFDRADKIRRPRRRDGSSFFHLVFRPRPALPGIGQEPTKNRRKIRRDWIPARSGAGSHQRKSESRDGPGDRRTPSHITTRIAS